MTISEYNRCVDHYSDGVFRFILKNFRDEDTSRDIVQDSFLKLWEKVSEVSFEKAKSYIFTTAYHAMIDRIRKEKYMEEPQPYFEHGHSEEIGFSDVKEVLDQAIRLLPDIQRTVILLRDYEGYSYQEIGDITHLSDSQVKVYIYRARVFLKNYIGKLENVI
ncbi:MAG TPA: sigma-70 family RNA polymerase sigma factor [Bacteroidales bacterium]|nr:sigma-70 family RNA polymerase sigma factor [Bacteroidales bacterium]HNS46612.1 sigma-70 family RNA polymerase sigma factor [Bacteroidales bacterium]